MAKQKPHRTDTTDPMDSPSESFIDEGIDTGPDTATAMRVDDIVEKENYIPQDIVKTFSPEGSTNEKTEENQLSSSSVPFPVTAEPDLQSQNTFTLQDLKLSEDFSLQGNTPSTSNTSMLDFETASICSLTPNTVRRRNLEIVFETDESEMDEEFFNIDKYCRPSNDEIIKKPTATKQLDETTGKHGTPLKDDQRTTVQNEEIADNETGEENARMEEENSTAEETTNNNYTTKPNKEDLKSLNEDPELDIESGKLLEFDSITTIHANENEQFSKNSAENGHPEEEDNCTMPINETEQEIDSTIAKGNDDNEIPVDKINAKDRTETQNGILTNENTEKIHPTDTKHNDNNQIPEDNKSDDKYCIGDTQDKDLARNKRLLSSFDENEILPSLTPPSLHGNDNNEKNESVNENCLQSQSEPEGQLQHGNKHCDLATIEREHNLNKERTVKTMTCVDIREEINKEQPTVNQQDIIAQDTEKEKDLGKELLVDSPLITSDQSVKEEKDTKSSQIEVPQEQIGNFKPKGAEPTTSVTKEHSPIVVQTLTQEQEASEFLHKQKAISCEVKTNNIKNIIKNNNHDKESKDLTLNNDDREEEKIQHQCTKRNAVNRKDSFTDIDDKINHSVNGSVSIGEPTETFFDENKSTLSSPSLSDSIIELGVHSTSTDDISDSIGSAQIPPDGLERINLHPIIDDGTTTSTAELLLLSKQQSEKSLVEGGITPSNFPTTTSVTDTFNGKGGIVKSERNYTTENLIDSLVLQGKFSTQQKGLNKEDILPLLDTQLSNKEVVKVTEASIKHCELPQTELSNEEVLEITEASIQHCELPQTELSNEEVVKVNEASIQDCKLPQTELENRNANEKIGLQQCETTLNPITLHSKKEDKKGQKRKPSSIEFLKEEVQTETPPENKTEMGKVLSRIFETDNLENVPLAQVEKLGGKIIISEDGEYAIVDFEGRRKEYKINKVKLRRHADSEVLQKKLRDSKDLSQLFEQLESLDCVGKSKDSLSFLDSLASEIDANTGGDRKERVYEFDNNCTTTSARPLVDTASAKTTQPPSYSEDCDEVPSDKSGCDKLASASDETGSDKVTSVSNESNDNKTDEILVNEEDDAEIRQRITDPPSILKSKKDTNHIKSSRIDSETQRVMNENNRKLNVITGDDDSDLPSTGQTKDFDDLEITRPRSLISSLTTTTTKSDDSGSTRLQSKEDEARYKRKYSPSTNSYNAVLNDDVSNKDNLDDDNIYTKRWSSDTHEKDDIQEKALLSNVNTLLGNIDLHENSIHEERLQFQEELQQGVLKTYGNKEENENQQDKTEKHPLSTPSTSKPEHGADILVKSFPQGKDGTQENVEAHYNDYGNSNINIVGFIERRDDNIVAFTDQSEGKDKNIECNKETESSKSSLLQHHGSSQREKSSFHSLGERCTKTDKTSNYLTDGARNASNFNDDDNNKNVFALNGDNVSGSCSTSDDRFVDINEFVLNNKLGSLRESERVADIAIKTQQLDEDDTHYYNFLQPHLTCQQQKEGDEKVERASNTDSETTTPKTTSTNDGTDREKQSSCDKSTETINSCLKDQPLNLDNPIAVLVEAKQEAEVEINIKSNENTNLSSCNFNQRLQQELQIEVVNSSSAEERNNFNNKLLDEQPLLKARSKSLSDFQPLEEIVDFNLSNNKKNTEYGQQNVILLRRSISMDFIRLGRRTSSTRSSRSSTPKGISSLRRTSSLRIKETNLDDLMKSLKLQKLQHDVKQKQQKIPIQNEKENNDLNSASTITKPLDEKQETSLSLSDGQLQLDFTANDENNNISLDGGSSIDDGSNNESLLLLPSTPNTLHDTCGDTFPFEQDEGDNDSSSLESSYSETEIDPESDEDEETQSSVSQNFLLPKECKPFAENEFKGTHTKADLSSRKLNLNLNPGDLNREETELNDPDSSIDSATSPAILKILVKDYVESIINSSVAFYKSELLSSARALEDLRQTPGDGDGIVKVEDCQSQVGEHIGSVSQEVTDEERCTEYENKVRDFVAAILSKAKEMLLLEENNEKNKIKSEKQREETVGNSGDDKSKNVIPLEENDSASISVTTTELETIPGNLPGEGDFLRQHLQAMVPEDNQMKIVEESVPTPTTIATELETSPDLAGIDCAPLHLQDLVPGGVEVISDVDDSDNGEEEMRSSDAENEEDAIEVEEKVFVQGFVREIIQRAILIRTEEILRQNDIIEEQQQSICERGKVSRFLIFLTLS